MRGDETRNIDWKIRIVTAARISIGECTIPLFGSICLVGNNTRIAGLFSYSLMQARHFFGIQRCTLFFSGSCTIIGQSRDKVVQTVAKGIMERKEKELYLAQLPLPFIARIF